MPLKHERSKSYYRGACLITVLREASQQTFEDHVRRQNVRFAEKCARRPTLTTLPALR
jgi:hypothetical protein